MEYSKKILIADESAGERQILRESLHRAGYRLIDEVSNGEEALQKLRHSRYDAVLLDLMLTRMEMDAPDRDHLIDVFIRDCKEFGVTEIVERTSMAVCRDIMKKTRYAVDRSERYSLYSIMQ